MIYFGKYSVKYDQLDEFFIERRYMLTLSEEEICSNATFNPHFQSTCFQRKLNFRPYYLYTGGFRKTDGSLFICDRRSYKIDYDAIEKLRKNKIRTFHLSVLLRRYNLNQIPQSYVIQFFFIPIFCLLLAIATVAFIVAPEKGIESLVVCTLLLTLLTTYYIYVYKQHQKFKLFLKELINIRKNENYY